MEWNNDELDDGFNTTIREFVIFFLLFIVLQFLSFGLISVYRKRFTIYSTDHEDVIVYRVSFWACSFSVSLAIGAVLLLPISIMSNEVLLYYPKSYFFRWLNISLIQGLWNSTFLLSNFALFILLPFAYFFSESQGFSGSCYKGIKGRIYETFSVLLLVGLLMSSLLCILCAIFEYPRNSLVPIFDLWSDYLPFVYSCVSFVGVLMLLVCTPVGFAHLFTVIGKLVSSEDLTRSIQTEISMLQCERANILVKINGFENVKVPQNFKEEHLLLQDLTSIEKQLEELQSSLRATKFRRTLGYPIAMLLLLAFTIISVLMVAQNILALCFGIKTLPIYSKNVSLGISSLSALGPLGALFEIILILYLWCSSVVGLYALPMFRNLKPKLRETPMTHMMGNSVVLLVLSSALPVLARTVGITNFDLLGDFGRIHWLGNMNIVMFYNVVFAGATATCLGTKITATMRQELLAIVRSAAIFRDSPPRVCTLPTDPCTDRYLLKHK